MIYAAVKNYDRALYMFEVVISTPALAVSHIMLEAYKKYILISLILHGKVIYLNYLLILDPWPCIRGGLAVLEARQAMLIMYCGTGFDFRSRPSWLFTKIQRLSDSKI